MEGVQNPTLFVRCFVGIASPSSSCDWFAHGFNSGNRAITTMKQIDPRIRFNLMLKFIIPPYTVRGEVETSPPFPPVERRSAYFFNRFRGSALWFWKSVSVLSDVTIW